MEKVQCSGWVFFIPSIYFVIFIFGVLYVLMFNRESRGIIIAHDRFSSTHLENARFRRTHTRPLYLVDMAVFCAKNTQGGEPAICTLNAVNQLFCVH